MISVTLPMMLSQNRLFTTPPFCLNNVGKFTSFVQMRGSIPLYWSQDNSNMAPKRPIHLDRSDPFGSAAARHFDELFKRYGTPVVVLNLVKNQGEEA